jgi:phage shock protein PspC (stress-responsive transcriptional regulator)
VANQRFNKNNVAIIGGAVLVLVGVYQLAMRFFGDTLGQIWKIVATVISILGPLVIIAAGIFLLFAARRGALNLPANRKLYRSTTNHKLAGVCGGIAEYFSADPAIVRIITIILGIICFYVVIPLYLVFWLLVPPDTNRFNTWG